VEGGGCVFVCCGEIGDWQTRAEQARGNQFQHAKNAGLIFRFWFRLEMTPAFVLNGLRRFLNVSQFRLEAALPALGQTRAIWASENFGDAGWLKVLD
jgi:hypothetical protein